MATASSTSRALAKRRINSSSTGNLTRLAFSLLLFTFFTASALAQSQFDVWDTDRGLPQNSIQAILQTRDGYLWLATFDGLVRFGGAQFTVFNSGNSQGLKSNRFTALFED